MHGENHRVLPNSCVPWQDCSTKANSHCALSEECFVDPLKKTATVKDEGFGALVPSPW